MHGADDYRRPKTIRSAGRFAHEAVAVDPKTGYFYQTEDNFGFPSGSYRYKAPRNPMEVGELRDGGRLEMLKVRGERNAELYHGQTPGITYEVAWVRIDDPDTRFTDGTTNDQAINFVGDQGRDKGTAIFSRLERTSSTTPARSISSQHKAATHLRGDEFAGATFGPGGKVLYVNIQASSGLTFAIWGPWKRGAL